MPYLVAAPEFLTSAASDLSNLGSAVPPKIVVSRDGEYVGKSLICTSLSKSYGWAIRAERPAYARCLSHGPLRRA
jgi:hypothetical protein